MVKRIMMILIFVSGWGALSAQGTGFYKGRVFLDFKGVQGAEFSGDLKTAEKSLNTPVPIDQMTLFYGTEEQQYLNYYARQSQPKPRAFSRGGDVAMEWAVSNHLGIGFGLHGEEYEIQNLQNTIDSSYLSSVVLLNSFNSASSNGNSLASTLIQLELLNTMNTGTVKVGTLKLAEFHMAYHFNDQSRFDPYIGFSVGLGQGDSSDTLAAKAGVNLGARIFLSDRFYMLTELDYSQIRLETETSNRTSVNSTIKETAGKIGFGVAF